MTDDLSQANILIVDDDLPNRKLLYARLKMAGFSHLILAASGQEALAFIEVEFPDLILLDVMMPEMNGFELTEYIREHYQNQFIPIILVSALQTPEQRTRGIDAGANDFVSRPFDPDELLARVNSLLALKKRRDALNEERQRIELLYLISQLLSSYLDYHSLKQEIASLTTSLTQADQTFLLLIDRDNKGEERVISRPGSSPYEAGPTDIDPLSDRLARHVMEHQKPLLIKDRPSDPLWDSQGGDVQVGSAAAVPLFHIDYLLGALVILSRQPNAFTEDQLNLLVALSSHASVALDNARLFGEVKQQRTQAEALLHSTGYPVTIVNGDGILTTINNSARQVLGLTEEHIGQALQDVFSLALADLQIRSKERVSAVSGEYTVRSGEGSDAENRTFNVSISPVESLGFVMIWQDITAIKEGERIRLESERSERKRILAVFSRYMSPALVERVLGDSDILSRRERRTALVLFADLRGFTRLTIEHPPDDVIELLNNVFTEMMEITYQHEGVIFDIAGDELLVAFNVPYEQPDASRRALSTAVAMLRKFRQLQKYWAGERGMHVGMGIGLNRGPVVLGHIGGRTRMNYAMVGLTVNVAHRLVDLACDGQIVATPEVIADGIPGVENLKIRELGAVEIKGLTEPQSVVLLELL